jgi:hypothetical protein
MYHAPFDARYTTTSVLHRRRNRPAPGRRRLAPDVLDRVAQTFQHGLIAILSSWLD